MALTMPNVGEGICWNVVRRDEWPDVSGSVPGTSLQRENPVMGARNNNARIEEQCRNGNP